MFNSTSIGELDYNHDQLETNCSLQGKVNFEWLSLNFFIKRVLVLEVICKILFGSVHTKLGLPTTCIEFLIEKSVGLRLQNGIC